MKAVLENSSSSNNFSFKQIRLSHIAKVLIFPFVLWVLYMTHYIDVVAFVHSQIFYGIAVVKRYSKDNYFIQISSFLLALILGVVLLRHQISGFGNYPIINQVLLSEGSVPYSLWFNKDSIIVGLSLIIVFYKHRPINKSVLGKTLLFTILGLVLLSGLSLFFELLRWDIKFVSFFGTWFLFNIMFVVIEEAFYRLFLLESVIRLYRGVYSASIASVVVSMFFGLAHYFYGNVTYAFLAFIVSIVYSYTYIACDRRLEASILCHVMVNIVHMLFFTYPFLK